MATRSTDAVIKQVEAGTDGEGEVEVEGKAPVHDASSAGHKVPTAVQAQDKAELAKVAQKLREDATEGEREKETPQHAVLRIIITTTTRRTATHY